MIKPKYSRFIEVILYSFNDLGWSEPILVFFGIPCCDHKRIPRLRRTCCWYGFYGRVVLTLSQCHFLLVNRIGAIS